MVRQREKLTRQTPKLARKCPVIDCYYKHYLGVRACTHVHATYILTTNIHTNTWHGLANTLNYNNRDDTHEMHSILTHIHTWYIHANTQIKQSWKYHTYMLTHKQTKQRDKQTYIPAGVPPLLSLARASRPPSLLSTGSSHSSPSSFPREVISDSSTRTCITSASLLWLCSSHSWWAFWSYGGNRET